MPGPLEEPHSASTSSQLVSEDYRMALMQQTSMKFVWAGSQRCWGWVYAHMGVYIYLMHTGIPARQLGCHAQFAEGVWVHKMQVYSMPFNAEPVRYQGEWI